MKRLVILPVIALSACASARHQPEIYLSYDGRPLPYSCGSHALKHGCSKDRGYRHEARHIPMQRPWSNLQAVYAPHPLPSEGVGASPQRPRDAGIEASELTQEIQVLKNVVISNAGVTNTNQKAMADKLHALEDRLNAIERRPASAPTIVNAPAATAGIRIPQDD